MNDAVMATNINRLENGAASTIEDVVAVEAPLEIRVNGRSVSITMRTPGRDLELAAGFLFSEGVIHSDSEILSIAQDASGSNIVDVQLKRPLDRSRVQTERQFLMTSACGVCGKTSLNDLKQNACPALSEDDIQLDPDVVYGLPYRLRTEQHTFDATGGLHAAARFSLEGDLECVREDVGRHNALDKLIGAAVLSRATPLNRSILLVSGRASFELVQKALVAGLPVLAAVGAPSSLAVSTAEDAGMTLIGFLKAGRFNVYAGAHRVCGLRR